MRVSHIHHTCAYLQLQHWLNLYAERGYELITAVKTSAADSGDNEETWDLFFKYISP